LIYFYFLFAIETKVTIVLNSMLPLVGIMNIMKINWYEIYWAMYHGNKVWFNGLEYTKTCSIDLKQNVEI
jgi:hypothetical protein